MNTYWPGNVVVVTATFLDPVTRAPLSVSPLKCRVLDPAGAETDHSDDVVSLGAGVYAADVPVVLPGLWLYRFEATGSIVAASEGAFTVNKSNFAPD